MKKSLFVILIICIVVLAIFILYHFLLNQGSYEDRVKANEMALEEQKSRNILDSFKELEQKTNQKLGL